MAVREGRTTCEKCLQLYSQCFRARELNTEIYNHDIDGRDDSAYDQ
jgi:hypothetical protein